MEICSRFRQRRNILVLLTPLLILAGGLAMVDVGWPIVFWQRRLGIGGRSFIIYKFRTLRPPFDQMGQPFLESKRLSWVGTLLRRTRLDELPQLFNVLVGDMSLFGPRPLLPCDQPADPSVRLVIRPGITGWAQVNGGTLLSANEKDALDEWYVQNASFWLDLRILMMTLRVMIWGQRRPHETLATRQYLHPSKELTALATPQLAKRGIG
jgi:lipopolysaccharide/colanic/teichoic acid biosynthesis glycosyltransferase